MYFVSWLLCSSSFPFIVFSLSFLLFEFFRSVFFLSLFHFFCLSFMLSLLFLICVLSVMSVLLKNIYSPVVRLCLCLLMRFLSFILGTFMSFTFLSTDCYVFLLIPIPNFFLALLISIFLSCFASCLGPRWVMCSAALKDFHNRFPSRRPVSLSLLFFFLLDTIRFCFRASPTLCMQATLILQGLCRQRKAKYISALPGWSRTKTRKWCLAVSPLFLLSISLPKGGQFQPK